MGPVKSDFHNHYNPWGASFNCDCLRFSRELAYKESLPDHICVQGAALSVKDWVSDIMGKYHLFNSYSNPAKNKRLLPFGDGRLFEYDSETTWPLIQKDSNLKVLLCIRQWVEEYDWKVAEVLTKNAVWQSIRQRLHFQHLRGSLLKQLEPEFYKKQHEISKETFENFVSLIDRNDDFKRKLVQGWSDCDGFETDEDSDTLWRGIIKDQLHSNGFMPTPGLVNYTLDKIKGLPDATTCVPSKGLQVVTLIMVNGDLRIRDSRNGLCPFSTNLKNIIVSPKTKTHISHKIFSGEPSTPEHLWRSASSTIAIHTGWWRSLSETHTPLNDSRRLGFPRENDLNEDIDLILSGNMKPQDAMVRNRERCIQKQSSLPGTLTTMERQYIEKKADRQFNMQLKRRKAKNAVPKAA